MITRKSPFELNRMRKAGEITALILSQVAAAVTPGITTIELDELAEAAVKKYQVKPAFKGYQGFPASICISVNDQVVHGIPGPRLLKNGDIVGLDFGVVYKGYYGDAAVTVGVGEVALKHRRLMTVTREALWQGINQARAGNRLSDISRAIQKHVEESGFSVVRDFVGHGIGQAMHEEPQVPNYVSSLYRYDPVLKPGMTLAIEPMVNAGAYQVKVSPTDQWTVTTMDGSYSAHFEHTVLVTAGDPEILTRVTELQGGNGGMIRW
ncbi:MAG TPA: type I methionyl aminopeptidase [Firmicutes bacterium]|jgi:methionyl aminopeptidase|nr:type I methionyl aminopeptidase [Bacillota bacterium]